MRLGVDFHADWRWSTCRDRTPRMRSSADALTRDEGGRGEGEEKERSERSV